MAPLPKRKISKARQGKRRKSIKLGAVNTVLCSHCHQPKLPHRTCPNCGYYNNREIIAHKPSEKNEPKE